MAVKDERDEIKALPDSELVEQSAAAKDNLFKLRFKRATGQLEDFSQLPKARRTVARLLTEVRAREIAGAEGTSK
jgi:large subunit ribosomal protein L29